MNDEYNEYNEYNENDRIALRDCPTLTGNAI